MIPLALDLWTFPAFGLATIFVAAWWRLVVIR